jgi:hypothetical protein
MDKNNQQNKNNLMNRINQSNKINQINKINQSNKINQINKINQSNKINQINKINQMNKINNIAEIEKRHVRRDSNNSRDSRNSRNSRNSRYSRNSRSSKQSRGSSVQKVVNINIDNNKMISTETKIKIGKEIIVSNEDENNNQVNNIRNSGIKRSRFNNLQIGKTGRHIMENSAANDKIYMSKIISSSSNNKVEGTGNQIISSERRNSRNKVSGNNDGKDSKFVTVKRNQIRSGNENNSRNNSRGNSISNNVKKNENTVTTTKTVTRTTSEVEFSQNEGEGKVVKKVKTVRRIR